MTAQSSEENRAAAPEPEEEHLNPFSPEAILGTWENNRTASLRLMEELREGKENGMSVRDQLLKEVEIIGRMTDNTIFLRIVRQALEARDQA